MRLTHYHAGRQCVLGQIWVAGIDFSQLQHYQLPGAINVCRTRPEINIDVEWAHAVAPGAAITLLVPPSASFVDIDSAWLYAVTVGLGNVISGSYGAEELGLPASYLVTQAFIAEAGAVLVLPRISPPATTAILLLIFPNTSPRRSVLLPMFPM